LSFLLILWWEKEFVLISERNEMKMIRKDLEKNQLVFNSEYENHSFRVWFWYRNKASEMTFRFWYFGLMFTEKSVMEFWAKISLEWDSAIHNLSLIEIDFVSFWLKLIILF
jgi:hypothetical protein